MKPDACSVFSAALLAAAIQTSTAIAIFPQSSRGFSRLKELFSRSGKNNTTVPVPISVSPSEYWDGDDGPWSSFAIQVGHKAQDVRVFPGTAATTTWTISPNACPPDFGPNCMNERGFTYNPNNSLTWVPNSIYDIDTEVNLGLDENGEAGFDDITLGWQGTGGPTAEHSIVFSLEGDKYWVGILGIDPRPTNFSDFTSQQLSMMQLLVNNNEIPSLSYGYTAGNQYRLHGVFGSLTLGGYDENRFVSTNVTFPFNADQSRDLSVNLQSITTDVGAPRNLLPDGGISILIDSTVAALWLPESACTAFEQAFGIEFDESYGYYLVNGSLHEELVAKNPNVTFTIGPEVSGGPTVDIVLPYAAFDLNLTFPIVYNPNTTAYFPLHRAANSTQYTLGRTFLQEAYLIADYERFNFSVAPCTWNQTQVQTSSLRAILKPGESLAGSDQGDTLSSGAIAGIVIGSVAVIVLLATAFYFIIRRRTRAIANKEAAETAAQKKLNSDTINDPKPSSQQGELDGSGIQEMFAPNKQAPQELYSPYRNDLKGQGYSEMAGGSYFEPNRMNASEMTGSTPVFEMAGSDVQELPTPDQDLDIKR